VETVRSRIKSGSFKLESVARFVPGILLAYEPLNEYALPTNQLSHRSRIRVENAIAESAWCNNSLPSNHLRYFPWAPAGRIRKKNWNEIG
jgi:hypothetical protein